MDRIRLALIGCGGMGTVHAQRFHRLESRIQVVAAVDVDRGKAESTAKLLGCARAETDFRQVLDDVDAVLLVLPHHLHHPIGMACLAAGKHVLLEKPMAISEQECLELIEASRKAQRVLMIAYCMRYHPLVARMKELLDQGTYGEVFQVSIWTEQYTQLSISAAMMGGGQLFSHGCHYIDILLWYLGRPVRGVHLGTNYGTPWMEREGTSNVVIEFEGGRLGYHFGTWGARGTRLGYSIHAHCTEGMIEADIHSGKLLLHRNGATEVLMECEEAGADKYTENEMVHFLDCIQSGHRPLTDGPGSLQGLRVIWHLYDAEERGTMADLRGLGLNEI